MVNTNVRAFREDEVGQIKRSDGHVGGFPGIEGAGDHRFQRTFKSLCGDISIM